MTKFRVSVRYYDFDFNDLEDAADFALKAMNSYVPHDEDEKVDVKISFVTEEV